MRQADHLPEADDGVSSPVIRSVTNHTRYAINIAADCGDAALYCGGLVANRTGRAARALFRGLVNKPLD